jgi:hypothetical protein
VNIIWISGGIVNNKDSNTARLTGFINALNFCCEMYKTIFFGRHDGALSVGEDLQPATKPKYPGLILYPADLILHKAKPAKK